MRHGRKNSKPHKSGFEKAAQALTEGLPEETVSMFTSLVREVAEEYGHNDSQMLRVLRRRLATAAKAKKVWAQEIISAMENKAAQRATV